MCGIAGYFAPGPNAADSRVVAERMGAALAHRGPDAAGLWADPAAGIALSHRRLAIVDLSPAGAQPMQSPSGRYVLVFNGEIFNFRELRAEMEARGHAFVGHSDTEVILHVVELSGIDAALSRLNGQFSVALWDREARSLTLARDRFGEKPLYYSVVDGALAFASELRSLRRVPGFDEDIDGEALQDLLRFGYVATPRTIYHRVRKLPAGTMLAFTLRDGRIVASEPRAYWSIGNAFAWARQNPFRGSFEQAIEELDMRLRRIVASRMVSDVPLGAFLSGGIDSSAVVSLMQSQSPRPVRTFTIGFSEGGFNESVHAEAVAKHLGTTHTTFTVTARDALDVVPRLGEIYDEPFADSSQIPTYLVAKLARSEVTVALTGDGGDEVFSGYNRYFWWRPVWGRFRGWPTAIRRLMGGAITSISAASYDTAFRVAKPLLPGRLRFGNPGERLHKLAPYLTAETVGDLYERMIAVNSHPATFLHRNASPAVVPDVPVDDERAIVDYMVGRDLAGYLPDDILVKVDRATMATSLESRAPFLDPELLAFSLSLPTDFRVRGVQGKLVLKRLLDRYVPRDLMERTKVGFAIPLGEWLRGPLKSWASDLLNQQTLKRDGFFDQAVVARVWAEHLSGRREHQHVLWPVLMFQCWRQTKM